MRALKASRSPVKFSANTGNPDASLEIKGSLTLFAQDGHLLMRAQGQANSLAREQLRKDLADIWILANTRLDVLRSRLSFKTAPLSSQSLANASVSPLSYFQGETYRSRLRSTEKALSRC